MKARIELRTLTGSRSWAWQARSGVLSLGAILPGSSSGAKDSQDRFLLLADLDGKKELERFAAEDEWEVEFVVEDGHVE